MIMKEPHIKTQKAKQLFNDSKRAAMIIKMIDAPTNQNWVVGNLHTDNTEAQAK